MVFLENNKKTRKQKKTEISLEQQSESIIIYLFAIIAYFLKKNVGKLILFSLITYLIYLRFLSKNRNETEMIDGMEVPKLKDNYDLSLD